VNTRRHFIKHLFVTSMVLAMAAEAQAKKPPRSRIRFTRQVRELTKGLAIKPGRWQWLIAHHSGIKNGNAAIYDRAHRERGMEHGLAYHFVIGNGIDAGDGEIQIGQRWIAQLKGGHVHREEMNECAIGICLVGNFEDAKPTARQVLAFRELMDYLRSEVVGKSARFAVHREVDPGRTVCPGRHFPAARMHRVYGKFSTIV
jgi:N-acetyl-anhydromuramyl-L-alanine amidase AmpD